MRGSDANWKAIKRQWLASGGRGVRAIGRAFGVAHTTISRRAKRERWNETVPALRSFLYDGSLFNPATEDIDFLRGVWGKRIGNRIKRESRVAPEDIISAWNEAAVYACRGYRYGDKLGFERLLNKAWTSSIVDIARNVDHAIAMDPEMMKVVEGMPMRMRTVANLRVEGYTFRQIQELTGLSANQMSDIKTQIEEQLR